MKLKKVGIAIVFVLLLSIVGLGKSTEVEARSWTPKTYTVNYQTYAYGMYQVGSKSLVPAGFKWFENGIPMNAVNYKMGTSAATFTFKADKVWDRGRGKVYDQGYYYKEFGTPWGNFYARAGSLGELLYR